MRVVAAVASGLLVLGASWAAAAQEAPEGGAPAAPPSARASVFVGAEVERVVYDQYVAWKPTSLGGRVGVLAPAGRRVAILGSIGLRTPILASTFVDGSAMGRNRVTTEHLTIPLEIGVRVTPVPATLAGYIDGGVRVLARKVTSPTLADEWGNPYYGLTAGGGLRGDGWEIGLHGTFLMLRLIDIVELGLGIRAAYHFAEF